MGNTKSHVEISSTIEYLEGIADKKEALKIILSFRNFELEHYWKRTSYFWAFIAAYFAAYFILADGLKAYHPLSKVLVVTLGLVFSLAWYLVNRGSKFWQENWERHYDILAQDIVGKSINAILNPSQFGFTKYRSAYPFSVTRINTVLSLYMCFIWLILMAIELKRYFPNHDIPVVSESWIFIAFAIATLAATINLFKSKTEFKNGRTNFIPREII